MPGLEPYWNSVVVDPLIWALEILGDFSGSGGLAIILMTIIIKTLLLPLSLQQTRSMKAMQAIQPEIAALKKKYKEREKVTQETMALYKDRGINPAAGCLPMVPTMIVLIGLYGALTTLACDPANNQCRHADDLFRQAFLWVPSLNHPDTFEIPGLQFALPGVLPIAMAITQFFSSRMMTMPSSDPQQAMMNRMTTVMMPGMMLFWGITFASGLVLYWFVSNLFEMVRLYFTMGPGSLDLGSLLPSKWRGRDDSEAVDGATGLRRNGALPPERGKDGETSGADAGPTSRPARARQKRGRRSGRR